MMMFNRELQCWLKVLSYLCSSNKLLKYMYYKVAVIYCLFGRLLNGGQIKLSLYFLLKRNAWMLHGVEFINMFYKYRFLLFAVFYLVNAVLWYLYPFSCVAPCSSCQISILSRLTEMLSHSFHNSDQNHVFLIIRWKRLIRSICWWRRTIAFPGMCVWRGSSVNLTKSSGRH